MPGLDRRRFPQLLQTTFTLSELGEKVIARPPAADRKFLLRNGADGCVPERELVYWTAIRYSSDNIADYVELSDGYAIFEISIPDRWNGKKVGDLDVRRKFHINILGIRSESGNNASYNRFNNSPHKKFQTHEMNMDVRSDTILHHGETLLVLGKHEHIQKFL